MRAFEVKTGELVMNPVIVGLRARVRASLVAELERSLSGKLKHLPAADREALSAMVDAATNKLCHRPTARLRALAADPRGTDAAETRRDLFDLPEHIAGLDDGGPAPAPADRDRGAALRTDTVREKDQPS